MKMITKPLLTIHENIIIRLSDTLAYTVAYVTSFAINMEGKLHEKQNFTYIRCYWSPVHNIRFQNTRIVATCTSNTIISVLIFAGWPLNTSKRRLGNTTSFELNTSLHVCDGIVTLVMAPRNNRQESLSRGGYSLLRWYRT